MEDNQHKQSKRGTPQGGVISPLLANIYLNPIDKAFEQRKLGNISEGSIHIVRYADDMLILAQSKLEKGITLLEGYLGRLGLKLNKEKSRRINLKEDKKVEFLGFQFHRVQGKIKGKRLILVAPSPKSLKKCRERIKQTVNHKLPLKIKEQVQNVNEYLTGWTHYFRLGNSSKALYGICQYTNRRVRKVMQRHKGRAGYGWYKITASDIYGRLGLFYNYKVQGLKI